VNRAARLARVSTLLALVAGVGACIDADGAPTRTPDVPATSATPTVAPTLDVPSPTPDEATPAVIDSTLLAYLPESIEGVPVIEDLDEAALALADPALPRIATAIDVGLALDAATGNLVIAHVVRLREGAFDDGTYRQWRDSYDDGACAATGGVDARLEAPIDGRTVFVTSCVGDQRVHHVWIEDQDLLISASSVGDGRFGELLMGELRV
jgi:hypothetical protein